MKTRGRSAMSGFSRMAQSATIAFGIWSGLAANVSYAGPVDGEGTAGVTITDLGNGQWVIIAPDGSIINYTSFDILAGEWVHFDQGGDPNARVLNRISGDFGASYIFGTLTADGLVFFVNPAGVYFGHGAVVDVGGLYAAAGNISDADFLAGNNRFDLTGEVVVDQGAAVRGHQIHLLGNRVANHGLLESDGGIITMLAGDTVRLFEIGGRLMVEVDGSQLTDVDQPYAGGSAPDMLATPGVENTGVIRNNGGRVIFGAGDMYSLAFRNTGTVEAAGGEINVAALDGLIQNDGLISTSVDSGDAGTITIQGPSVLNRGEIRADSNQGQAGTIEVTSQNHTFLGPDSVISAAGGSGLAIGGDVLVHSYHGQTIFAADSLIDVSGGLGGGNAGTAEVSGQALIFNGTMNLGAQNGFQNGLLKIDPVNIFINLTGGDDAFLDDNIIEFAEGAGFDSFIAASTFLNLNGFIELQATNNIFVEDEIILLNGNSMLFQANNNIYLYAPITGVQDLTLNADADGNGEGFISIDVLLNIAGDAIFRGTDVFLRQGGIITGGTQSYFGDTWIGSDMALTGNEIFFHNRLNSKSLTPIFPHLTLNGDVTFEGTVGDELLLRSLTVNGLTQINGGLVRTEEYQRYFGNVSLGADAEIVSVEAGELLFAAALDGPHNLLLSTSGYTVFEGTVGGNAALASVTTDAPGATRIAADMTAGDLDFNDAVALGADVTLTGSGSVDFASSIAGNGNDLIVNSPTTAFHGDVWGIGLLATDAAGTTLFDDADATATVLDFGDAVLVSGHVRLEGIDSVDFASTLDGAADLSVISDGVVRFGDDVGGATALAALTVDAGTPSLIGENLIIFDGNLVRAEGDISLNAGGRLLPSQVASIAGRGGDLLIESLNGDFFMGFNEKLTALGDLTIRAGGAATIGDMNSAGDMLVDASQIGIWTRIPSLIRNAAGQLSIDFGVDFVALGSIDFTSTPSVLGNNALPVFALQAGQNIVQRLGQFLTVSLNSLALGDFTFGSTVLDLSSGVGGRSVTTLAESFTPAPNRIKPKVNIDPFALRQMEQLGIYMRPLDSEELVGITSGLAMYDDAPTGGLQRTPQPLITTSRLSRDGVLEVLDRHSQIFLRTEVDPATGDVTREDLTGEIRRTLTEAWENYLNAGHEGRFRGYCMQQDDVETLACLDGLHELFREIWQMGTTPLELRTSLDGVLAPICPSSMEQSALEEAIGIGSSAL